MIAEKYLTLFLYLSAGISSENVSCLCDPYYISNIVTSKKYTACLFKSSLHHILTYADNNFKITTIRDVFSSSSCDVIFEPTEGDRLGPRVICPGSCSCILRIEFNYSMLISPPSDDFALTCSSTFSMLHSWPWEPKNATVSLGVAQNLRLIHMITFRRMAECTDNILWSPLLASTNLKSPRRKVYSVIVWVGSGSRKYLGELQQSVLSEEPFHGENGVIGWSVDEQIFPCNNGSTRYSYYTIPLFIGTMFHEVYVWIWM